MEEKAPSLNTFLIASTFIGTLVGAGFASGQEVLLFFSAYGWTGLWGVALATFLFFFFSYSILMLGNKLQATSHVDIVRFTNGKLFGSVIDMIITLFLFGGLAAMIAGAGAIFDEQLQLPAVWGTILMAFLTLVTVLTGTKGVVKAISYVVPFLLLSVLFISIYSFATNPITDEEINLAAQLEGAAPNWGISSINYVSYNIVIGIAVLAPMGARAVNKQQLFKGALAGGLGLGLGVLAIYFTVLTNMTYVANTEVPMINIAATMGPGIQIGFAVLLFGAVYTTAVGCLYGFIQRTAFIKRIPQIWVIIGSVAVTLALGQLGFSTMVKYLYPAVGYGGMLFFLGVIYVWVRKREYVR
ncbi:YkvI family membrane protein [Bacillus marinisedimentorum]|uniref:YkvI family membrane protein n=1 Tax=Bacillus marinisedimentorum TaxID=1821260 RepID=UPI0007DEFA11|nr:hypothetical protein [Bacillus marinisedimentorum]